MKKLFAICTMLLMLLALAACGGVSGTSPASGTGTTATTAAAATAAATAAGGTTATAPSQGVAGGSMVVNPVEKSTAADIKDKFGVVFSLPGDAKDTVYTVVKSGSGVIAEAAFTLKGVSVTCRIMPKAAGLSDISGMYYNWTSKQACKIGGCDGTLTFISGAQGVVAWYDASAKQLHSISVDSGAGAASLTALAEQTVKAAAGPTSAAPSPAEVAFDDINPDKLTFDEATSRFFGGDVNAALKTLRPLLDAAAATEKVLDVSLFYSGDLPKDGGFAWNMMFRYINIYCVHDKNITAKDGNLIIPAAVMKGYFNTAFSGFQGALPDIPSDLASFLKLDKSTGAYTMAAAGGDEYAYRLKSISLSKAESAAKTDMSATLTLEISTPADGKTAGSVNIEVKPNAASQYRFSIQSVSPAD